MLRPYENILQYNLAKLFHRSVTITVFELGLRGFRHYFALLHRVNIYYTSVCGTYTVNQIVNLGFDYLNKQLRNELQVTFFGSKTSRILFAKINLIIRSWWLQERAVNLYRLAPSNHTRVVGMVEDGWEHLVFQ